MFRGAVRGDLPQILQIYAHAREAMAASGNPTQWGDNFTQEDYAKLVADMFNGVITVSNDITAMPAVTNVNVEDLGNLK